jgi:hypothetical protein
MISKTSKLSGFHTDDGITLEVKIYLYGGDDEWTLSVIAPDGCESVFGQGFDTEHEALEEFRKTINKYGAEYFLRPPQRPTRVGFRRRGVEWVIATERGDHFGATGTANSGDL